MTLKSYLLALASLCVYLLVADHFFLSVLKVPGEAEATVLPVPSENKDMRVNVEAMDLVDVQWKRLLAVRGWAWWEAMDTASRRFVVLQPIDLPQQRDPLVFEAMIDPQDRADVAAALHGHDNFLGVKALLPWDRLPIGRYRVGFMVRSDGHSAVKFDEGDVVQKREDNGFARLQPLLPYPGAFSRLPPLGHQEEFDSSVCNLEKVSVEVDPAYGVLLRFHGWIALGEEDIGPIRLVAERDGGGQFGLDFIPNRIRADVSMSKNLPPGSTPGFLVTARVDSLEPGEYSLALHAGGTICDNGRRWSANSSSDAGEIHDRSGPVDAQPAMAGFP